VLRVSNIDAVASYLLGGDRTGTLPVAGSFDEQVLGSVLADVKVNTFYFDVETPINQPKFT
jgi:hypothetical protein